MLTVFRYDTSDLACGQLALNLSSNTLYYRVYVTGVWREWSQPFANNSTIPIANGGTGATSAAEALAALGGVSKNSDSIELGRSLSSTAGYGGYIDFHFNGSTEDYTARLMETAEGTLRVYGNLDVSGWVQCSNGLWIASGGFYASNNTGMVYGTSLPSAGTKGRIFFKKV